MRMDEHAYSIPIWAHPLFSLTIIPSAAKEKQDRQFGSSIFGPRKAPTALPQFSPLLCPLSSRDINPHTKPLEHLLEIATRIDTWHWQIVSERDLQLSLRRLLCFFRWYIKIEAWICASLGVRFMQNLLYACAGHQPVLRSCVWLLIQVKERMFRCKRMLYPLFWDISWGHLMIQSTCYHGLALLKSNLQERHKILEYPWLYGHQPPHPMPSYPPLPGLGIHSYSFLLTKFIT